MSFVYWRCTNPTDTLNVQATALVGDEVREVRQSKAVPEVKQGHDGQLRSSAP